MLSGYWWPDHYQALLELADEATSARDAGGFDLANIERMALLSFPRSAHEYPAVVQLRQVDEAVLGHAWAGAGYRREAGQAPQALVAISWADCTVARRARDFVAAQWEALALSETVGAAGRAFALEGEWRVLPVASACVLLDRILTGEAEEPSPFLALSQRLDTYQLRPLQPGRLPPF